MMHCKAEPSERTCDDEFLYVDVAPTGNDKSFVCVKCEKEFAKSSAFKHFTRKTHSLNPEVVKNWTVCKDGTALRNNRPHRMQLGAACARKRSREEPVYAEDSEEEIHVIAKKLPIPRSWTGAESERIVRRRVRGKCPPSHARNH